jgi:predicted nucleic acid-binding protein
MPQAIIDSNVLLDVLTEDPNWFSWSSGMLDQIGDDHVLVMNPIIYAEVSVRFDRIEDLDEALRQAGMEGRPIPWEAAFLAGKCFVRYRRGGGVKRSVLPDFFIGAHAAVEDMVLLTRDEARYRTYFPTLTVISPP